MFMHNPLMKNHTMYNNWNFTSTYLWDSLTDDSFWYSDKTSLLYGTNLFVIGES
jgi:hypothetical protein